MKKRCLAIGLTALSILMLTLSTVLTRGNVSAAPPPPKVFAGYIPSAVTTGQARLIGHHLGTDQLVLAIGLPLRNEQALTQLLQEVSTPRNPHYRHYLTLTQENQAFNPTPQQEHQVIAWLQANGLTVSHTYPNHLLVDTLGTFAQVERLLHITLNDYTASLDGKVIAFYAPATEPIVPGAVGSLVDSIVGLDNFPRVHTDNAVAQPSFTNGKAHGQPPFYPQDFANAYNVNPLWNLEDTGSNQHIGITHWGTPPSDATLNKFAQKTGANVATQKTNGRLRVIKVPCSSGCYYNTQGGLEAGIDVESSSGMAPGATIDYYQVPTDVLGNPTDPGLLRALNLAGSDGNDNQQISNSWYRECETQDSFTTSLEKFLKANTATGHDYFFGSGDHGSACVDPFQPECSMVQDPYPSYPASSAYVTSVGGTKLSIQNNSWHSEVAWHYSSNTCLLGGQPPTGSGGGYSKLFAQPYWQVGFSKNKHRGYPDVAADADPSTGAYICYDSSSGPMCTIIGNIQTYGNGTSLAAPLWAGMIADVNQYVQSQNELPLGFINPLLYEMHTGMPYTAYHDIVNGKNGKYKAGLGWDAVTGLGSPDLYNLARDAAILDALPHSLTPINLDTNGCFFTPLGISDSGIVGGNSQCTNEDYSNAAIWQSGSSTQFSEPPSVQHVAQGMSSTGDVVGYYQLNSNQLQFHAVKWASNGTPTDLGGVPANGPCDPSTGSTLADAENDVGDVAGYCWDANNFYAGYWPGGAVNSFTKLPDISNAFGYSYAMGINHSGNIIGFSGFYDPNNAGLGVVDHAVHWQNGTASDITPAGAIISQAIAINDNNLVVGSIAYSETDPNNHAYVWDLVNNTSYDLYTLTGYSAHAYAVSNTGVVVGDYDTHNGDPNTSNHAFMWKAGSGFVDLNNLIAADSGWTLTSAVGINSSGQIVGTGFINGGFQHYLLNTSTGKTPLISIPGVLASKFSVTGSQPIDPIVGQTLSQVSNNIKRSGMRSKS